MPNDADLTDQLRELLLNTAKSFLRMTQEKRCGRMNAAEYEIRLAVRRRAAPHYRSDWAPHSETCH